MTMNTLLFQTTRTYISNNQYLKMLLTLASEGSAAGLCILKFDIFLVTF